MKHARSDYDTIQDPSGKIATDEPVMLFRAQDVLMPKVLDFYAMLLRSESTCIASPADSAHTDHPLIAMARVVEDHRQEVLAWQFNNGAKILDLPDGSLRAGEK